MACAALRSSTGGWLHVHGNVSTHAGPRGSCAEALCQVTESHRNHGAESNPWKMEETTNPSDNHEMSLGMCS